METVRDFIFLDSKITADGNCRHEIKRCLFLGRKAMTTLDSMLKSRDITLPTIAIYRCESWTIKKSKSWRTDVFELWCWRRLLRILWTARSTQSILKEISPGIYLQGMMLKLKLQYFGHLMRRAGSLDNNLLLGEVGGRRRRGQQKLRWLHGITCSMDPESEWTPGVGDGLGGLVCCVSWGCKESDMTERLNWTELKPDSELC